MTIREDLAVLALIKAAGLDVDSPTVDADDDGEGLITVTSWSVCRRVCFERSATNGRDAATAPADCPEPGWDWEVFKVDEGGWVPDRHGWAESDAAMTLVLVELLPLATVPEAPPAG